MFFPDNILGLFKRYKVRTQFDFLSVDTDSYDFFMLETILEVRHLPGRWLMFSREATDLASSWWNTTLTLI